MRLDKLLADCGFGTRSEVKKMIRNGWVEVNGIAARSGDQKVDENTDTVTVDGNEVHYQKFVYFMLNKPQGYISATEGQDPVVLDLIDEPYKDLFPCGRLDKDTTGLLLITNDGPLAHRLLSPKHHVEKEYIVTHESPLSEADIRKMAEGITWQSETYRPAVCRTIDDHTCSLIISEGKFHEIKKIFEALGNKVTALARIRMKNLVLDGSLAPGEYRPLSEEELKDLRADS